MQIIADLHMHTNVTAHAYSTLTEMVQAAEGMGLAAIAITNHGPTNPALSLISPRPQAVSMLWRTRA